MVSIWSKYNRWSDNDRHFGPFLYAKDSASRLSFVLQSGREEYPGASIRVSIFGRTLITAIPSIVKPWRRWVDTSQREWAKSEDSGYWDIYPREFGFSVSKGFVQVFFGAQTYDSSTTRDWSGFLPWTQYRQVRHSFYGLEGDIVRGEVQCVSFEFKDFDDELIVATTKIEEREWKLGAGWFKWLSWFRGPKIRRSLDIKFSKETGREKGSWKGGTVGHSIDMEVGELHEEAFKRYCAENEMIFVQPNSIRDR